MSWAILPCLQHRYIWFLSMSNDYMLSASTLHSFISPLQLPKIVWLPTEKPVNISIPTHGICGQRERRTPVWICPLMACTCSCSVVPSGVTLFPAVEPILHSMRTGDLGVLSEVTQNLPNQPDGVSKETIRIQWRTLEEVVSNMFHFLNPQRLIAIYLCT